MKIGEKPYFHLIFLNETTLVAAILSGNLTLFTLFSPGSNKVNKVGFLVVSGLLRLFRSEKCGKNKVLYFDDQRYRRNKNDDNKKTKRTGRFSFELYHS